LKNLELLFNTQQEISLFLLSFDCNGMSVFLIATLFRSRVAQSLPATVESVFIAKRQPQVSIM